MLNNIIGGFFKQAAWTVLGKRRARKVRIKAENAFEAGDHREAIKLYERYLDLVPDDTNAIIQFGASLSDVGQEARAQAAFELAYQLDDSNMAAVVNHAKCLVDKRKVAEALPHLVRAQTVVGDSPHVASVYSNINLMQANAADAKLFALRAWLGNFDNLRLGNGYLFTSAYADIPEETLAAEHDFWAETYAPLPYATKDFTKDMLVKPAGRKLRIGYWSPDLREHSVRFFFRPLLEGHDRDRVELVVYHDSHMNDQHTESVKTHCDHFHDVYEKKDEELYKLIISHDLDVLVELAGHTSFNRLPMFKARMARMQVTGIGYPFSTGMRTIDAKILDAYLHTADDKKFYAEQPLILPSSFWCFDPKMEVAAPIGPPLLKNGYVTFGCSGNVGKINDRILACWAEILRRVPRSRLVLRSVSFEEPYSIGALEKKLLAVGLPRHRFDLHRPAIGMDFYASYNDIDIVLDTYPFNGGTTTSFSVYMGVPVVSWRGASLVSRMGHTVLHNVGAGDLSVEDAEQYINRAVKLSQDVPYLKRFRQEARNLMAGGSVGDGKKIAREFEDACEEFLSDTARGLARYQPAIAILSPEEIVGRAYKVFGFGQREAAKRIVAYCLRHYPDFAAAHIMDTDRLTEKGDFQEAADELLRRIETHKNADAVAILINVFRYLVLAGNREAAEKVLQQLESNVAADANERLQFHMFRTLLDLEHKTEKVVTPEKASGDGLSRRIRVLVPCDDVNTYDVIVGQMKKVCIVAPYWKVEYVLCSEGGRLRSYSAALGDHGIDALVILQKNVLVHQPRFFEFLLEALTTADLVGYFGSTRWDRLDWGRNGFASKSKGCIAPSADKKSFWEAQILGDGMEEIQHGMCLLAGDLLAIRPGKAAKVAFDADLIGGNNLLEQVWAYDAAQAGCCLAVHRNLGVAVGDLPTQDSKYLATVRMQVAERMKFDVLAPLANDQSVISVPCSSVDEALGVLGQYLTVREPVVGPE